MKINMKRLLGSLLTGGVDYLVGLIFVFILGIIFNIIIAVVTAVASILNWIASWGWIFGWGFQFQMYMTILSLLMTLSKSNPLFLILILGIAILYGLALIIVLKIFRIWFNLRGWYLLIKALVCIAIGVVVGFLFLSSAVDLVNLMFLYSGGLWIFWMTPLHVALSMLLFYGIAEGVSLLYGFWR